MKKCLLALSLAVVMVCGGLAVSGQVVGELPYAQSSVGVDDYVPITPFCDLPAKLIKK